MSAITDEEDIVMKVLRRITIQVLVVIFLMISICYAESDSGYVITDMGDSKLRCFDIIFAGQPSPGADDVLRGMFECYHKGMEYSVEGKFEEAKEELEKALKADSSFASAKLALRAVEDARSQKVKNQTSSHFFRGVIYMNKGRWNQAISEFTKAMTTDSNYALAFLFRGTAYFYKNQHNRAISDLAKAIEIDPMNVYTYMLRGIAYDETEGQIESERALTDFTKVIELDPRNKCAYNNRANIYRIKGQYEKAISDYNMAIEIDPKLACAYQQKGWACEKSGQIKEAIVAYKNFIRYALPEHQELLIEYAKQRIKALEK